MAFKFQIYYTLPLIRLKDTPIAPFTVRATHTLLYLLSILVRFYWVYVFIVPLSFISLCILQVCAFISWQNQKQVAASILAVFSGIFFNLILCFWPDNIWCQLGNCGFTNAYLASNTIIIFPFLEKKKKYISCRYSISS